jgi:hypothetical protein
VANTLACAPPTPCSQVAVGRREKLTVHGGDYDTPDGTCLRDYIHVVDLAKGHVKAIEWLARHPEGGCDVFNLGTGTPRSVMEMLRGFERACGKSLKFEVGPRRVGDIPSTYAKVDKVRARGARWVGAVAAWPVAQWMGASLLSPWRGGVVLGCGRLVCLVCTPPPSPRRAVGGGVTAWPWRVGAVLGCGRLARGGVGWYWGVAACPPPPPPPHPVS